jgi:hypothetical protein
MKSSSKVSANPPLHDRCHHLSPAGRRCSQPACSSHPTLCFTHAPKPPSPEVAVAAELFEAAGSLETPEDVNHLLTKTVLAFIAGRLPLKKAGMIGFLGQIPPIAKSPSTNRSNVNSTPGPSSTTSLALIAAKSSNILPNHFSLPTVKTYSRPPTSRPPHQPQQPHKSPRLHKPNRSTRYRPHRRLRPMRPKKSPTLATSTQTTLHSTRASTPITPFPTFPPNV